MEEYSIDEAFVDLTGLRRSFHGPYSDIAQRVQETVAKELGISASIGVSLTKVLAKVASKHKKPCGLTIIPGRDIHIYLCKSAGGEGMGDRAEYFGVSQEVQYNNSP